MFGLPHSQIKSVYTVPVGGISGKSSGPEAKQPLLQCLPPPPAPLSDSNRRTKMMALPARAFDFVCFFFFFLEYHPPLTQFH